MPPTTPTPPAPAFVYYPVAVPTPGARLISIGGETKPLFAIVHWLPEMTDQDLADPEVFKNFVEASDQKMLYLAGSTFFLPSEVQAVYTETGESF